MRRACPAAAGRGCRSSSTPYWTMPTRALAAPTVSDHGHQRARAVPRAEVVDEWARSAKSTSCLVSMKLARGSREKAADSSVSAGVDERAARKNAGSVGRARPGHARDPGQAGARPGRSARPRSRTGARRRTRPVPTSRSRSSGAVGGEPRVSSDGRRPSSSTAPEQPRGRLEHPRREVAVRQRKSPGTQTRWWQGRQASGAGIDGSGADGRRSRQGSERSGSVGPNSATIGTSTSSRRRAAVRCRRR